MFPKLEYLAACFTGSAFATLGWLVAAERLSSPVKCEVVNTPEVVRLTGENHLLRHDNFRLQCQAADLGDLFERAEARAKLLEDAARRSAVAVPGAAPDDADRIPPQAVPVPGK